MVWDKGGKKRIVFCLGMLCARLRYILKHVQRELKQVIYFYLFDFFFFFQSNLHLSGSVFHSYRGFMSVDG